jgi:hypothetical protein
MSRKRKAQHRPNKWGARFAVANPMRVLQRIVAPIQRVVAEVPTREVADATDMQSPTSDPED